MAWLPRGFLRGLMWGGAVAVLWGLLSDRRRRMTLMGRVMKGVEPVPYLGSRINAVVAPQLMGIYRSVAEDATSEISSGELLEIASGPGFLAVELGQRARELEITTMDISSYVVQMAESRVHTAGLGRQVKVVLGDPHDIPFPDDSFDAAITLGSLRRWRQPEVVLGEIHRVLKPSGRAWLYELRKEMPEEGWEQARQKLPAVERPLFELGVLGPREEAYTEGEIAALVARSPFKQARIGVVTADLAGVKAPAITKVSLQK